MSGLADLPEDILLRIVSFVSPPDIIRLRQVSKTFHSVTYQPVVWIRAYENAALPRPPGPYLRTGDKEGLMFLERALVQSAKVEPWSTRHFHPLHAVRTSPRFGEYANLWHFSQWGSWFITTIKSSVVYRNLNSDDPQTHVLFRLDDSSSGIDLLRCVDTVTLAGHPVTYVLIKASKSAYPLTLLKIVGHFRPSLSLEAIIPLSYPRHDEVVNIIASPRYVCIYGESMPKDGEFNFALLDVTTEKIYHLPAFKTNVAPEILERLARYSYEPRVNFLFTNTHILVTFVTTVPDHHIQAFRLPSEVESSATDSNRLLRMTHEGICEVDGPPEWVLRGNTVTNVGGVQTTEIRAVRMVRLVCRNGKFDAHEYSAIDLTLTASSSPGIGTITLSQCTPLICFEEEDMMLFEVGSSEDGFGRGVCFMSFDGDSGGVQTFSVDASGPVCRVDLGPRQDVSMPEPWEGVVQFNAWNGEVCYMLDNIRVHKFV